MVTKVKEETEDVWAEPTVPVNDRDFLTVTLKAGSGYDAPWLVFHTNSVEEALTTLQHEQLDELMDLTARKGKELAKAFGGPQGVSKPAGNSSWGNKTQPAQQASGGSSERPTGTCPTHNCDLQYVEPFTKRDGSTISARVACPVPKCYAKTFWHNKDGSWTEK